MKELPGIEIPEADRLKIGVNGPSPLHHVSEELLAEIAEVLVQVTRHPSRCISTRQLRQVAEKGVAQVYVYERRMKMVAAAIDQFQEQVDQLDKDNPMRQSFTTMLDTFRRILTGDYK